LDIERLEVATAVPVRIGSRLLLATSGHTIRDRFRDGLPVVTNQLTEARGSRMPVINLERRDWPDVGFIELEPDELERVGKCAIGLDRICNVGTGSQERLAFVYGYPSKKVTRLREIPGRLDLDFKGVSYCNVPLTIDNWPKMRSADDPVPKIETDILLRYDLDEPMVHFPQNEGDDELMAPNGMSGGGWWQSPDKENGDLVSGRREADRASGLMARKGNTSGAVKSTIG
jgi:hypothetical protein